MPRSRRPVERTEWHGLPARACRARGDDPNRADDRPRGYRNVGQGDEGGAGDFLAKPFAEEDILAAVMAALEVDRQRRTAAAEENRLRDLYENLSPREREIMGLVTAGLMNKQVAGRLDLSEITVKIHRGNVMRKMVNISCSTRSDGGSARRSRPLRGALQQGGVKPSRRRPPCSDRAKKSWES